MKLPVIEFHPHRVRAAASALAWAASGLVFLASSASAQPELWIRDVTVLPMTGEGALEHRTVVVDKGRIERVKPTDDRKANKRVQVIDGAGGFLLPGLVDAHVHINRSPSDMRRLFDLFLFHGVTTVINLEGSKRVVEARERIHSGEDVGPNIVTSGAILRGSDKTTQDQGRRFVQMQVEGGYDLIKVYNPLSEAGYRGVVDEAKTNDIPVAGHAVRSVGIEGALASGQHIVHMEEMVYGYFTWKSDEREGLPSDILGRLDILLDEAQVPALARRVKQAGIWVTPNLVAYHGILEQTNDLAAVLARKEVAWMPHSMQGRWQPDVNGYVNRTNQERFKLGVNRTYPFLETLTRAFYEAGVPLLAGTDVGIPVVVAGTSLHRELELLVAAGLPAMAALETATRSAADFLKRSDLGRITEGARADLVLLLADPRDDIRNTREIEAVVVAGRVFDREGFAASLREVSSH